MKKRIIISTNEALTLFEKTKIITQNKKKKIDKLYKKSRKNIIIEFIIILKEVENENKIFKNDNDDKNKLKL